MSEGSGRKREGQDERISSDGTCLAAREARVAGARHLR